MGKTEQQLVIDLHQLFQLRGTRCYANPNCTCLVNIHEDLSSGKTIPGFNFFLAVAHMKSVDYSSRLTTRIIDSLKYCQRKYDFISKF